MIERSCARQEAAVGRPARQCGGRLPGAGAARRAARRRHRPDLGARSDQRLSAEGLDARRVGEPARAPTRRAWSRPPSARWPSTCAPCWSSTSAASRPSTTATTSARWRKDEGVADAFDFPGFVPAYIRPLFCRGIGPFRWAALSGDPEDIYRTDAKVKELMPDDAASAQLARHGAGRASSSRACRRASAGWASATGTGSGSPSTRWWRAAS